VTSPAGFRRLERALTTLALTVVLAVALAGFDAIRFHVTSSAPAAALALLEAAMLVAAGAAVWRRVRGQRAFLRRLPVIGERRIDGRAVTVVGHERPLAFTAGFLRPRIVVSDATLALLDGRELRAVLAHEAHHVHRRDPLRLLAVGALAAAVPVLRSLGRRQAALAELAADAAAVRALGDPRPLASAMLAFDGSGPPGVVGIAPERVDHLLGDADPVDVPAALLALAGGALAVLALAAARMALGHDHVELLAPLGTSTAIAALVLLALPAWLVSRRIANALRPVSDRLRP
jgi:Zn-dependent protease with chaperone function